MIFDGKPTDQITPEEIEAFVRDGVEENGFLDYKARPYARDDRGVHELVKDVSAFANAQGGYLIIGVGEDADHPRRPGKIVNVDDPESERRRMIDHCFGKIEPRLSELDIRSIDVDGQSLLICRVPEGPQKPYCAWPDREHHYFWRRYEDGNRLMSVPEIRACLDGDRVARALTELGRELSTRREREMIDRELQQEVSDDRSLLNLRTAEAFVTHADRLFQEAIGNRPYFRLTATPLPVDGRDIREHAQALSDLLSHPPSYRTGGFDLCLGLTHDGVRRSQVGLLRPSVEYKHLRLYWNGHLEFWNEADDDWITFGEWPSLPPEKRPFAPLTLAESTAAFVRLTREICHAIDFPGTIEFRLGLHNIQGRRLFPFTPGTNAYLSNTAYLSRQNEIGVFHEDRERVGPVTAAAVELPGTVAWQLISSVYFDLGYERKDIPFFDDQGRFVFDVQAEKGG